MLNCFIPFLLVAYRVYNYSIFASTFVGEGPSANGSFLTREDSKLINNTLSVFINCTVNVSTSYSLLQYELSIIGEMMFQKNLGHRQKES